MCVCACVCVDACLVIFDVLTNEKLSELCNYCIKYIIYEYELYKYHMMQHKVIDGTIMSFSAAS